MKPQSPGTGRWEDETWEESWWCLSPLHPGTDGPWASTLAADVTALPLYLRNPTRNYWFEPLPDRSALYVQIARSSEDSDEPFAAFQAQLLDAIQDDTPQRIVIDLRFNTGGNLAVPLPLFRALTELSLAREPGRLYVITGHPTFSAGVFHAAHTGAVADLQGPIWRRVVSKDELAPLEAEHAVISTKLLAGRTVVHVYDEARPGPGFEAVEPDLEDVYFSAMAGHLGRRSR